ncbi:hypothetical protein ASPTUDRAFT_917908 [Aspergillus tubingensis CBS 134.48]|uniref:EthD domain-containing protein n=1 Tax=Aspergillus tubingensis (strain CBS 134.48) TaxID=767770 RepID=A0A1L9NKT3_ASPTC|nr:hypothetical protein ASPTUDRAFT_917908 [Aspergillus tubingensis CBS 134.48]
MAFLKQIAVVRRKAGMTKEEFFEYHYQRHGGISTGPTPAETPAKYFQTHFIDAAYHPDANNKVPNAHPPWAFSDDITELYFESPEHLVQVFKSDWVAKKVGPDGVNFSDFSAILPMFMKEEEFPIPSVGSSRPSHFEENTFVAAYFVAFHGKHAPRETVSQLTASLENYAPGEVRKLIVNTPAETGFDLGAYFGGECPIQYQFVFTITLQGKQSISAIRRAQKEFEEHFASQLDLPSTWIGFGERAVVLDQAENVKFDLSRQPFKTM